VSLLFSLIAFFLGPFIQLISHQYGTAEGLPGGGATRVLAEAGAVYAWADGCYRLDGARWEATAACPAAIQQEPDLPELTFPARYFLRQPWPNTDARVQAVADDGAGHRWIGTDQGILATTGDDYLHFIAPAPGGLPYPDVTALALDPATGWVWVGFSEGAALWQDGQWRYFWGRLWMPGNRVHGIAPDGAGGAWLATDGGVAHLEARRVDLEDKAQHYEAVNAARHNRYGYTTDSNLLTPGDVGTSEHQASDNDGLWTSLTVAAEAFRYAVTGEEEARQLARTSMRALLDLVYKSGSPGFPARAVARVGEENVELSDYSPERWKASPEEGWLFKTDTSSD
jgi:hypothetical protein